MKNVDVVIIGGGPAGMAAAIWCKRLGIRSMLLEKRDRLGGQLHHVKNDIIDYPGFYQTDGKALAHQFEMHVRKMEVPFRLRTEVVEIDGDRKVVRTEQDEIAFHYLLYAAGAKEKRLGIPGEKEMHERGEIYSTSKHWQHFAGKRVIIVGGGDRAFEGAKRVADTAASVTLIHRRNRFRARKELYQPVAEHPNVRILPYHRLLEISGEDCVREVLVRDDREREEKILPADIVLIRIGIEPNSALISRLVSLRNGYVKTDDKGRTDLKWLYAVGDAVNLPEYSSISLSVGQAVLAVKSISLELDQRKAEADL